MIYRPETNDLVQLKDTDAEVFASFKYITVREWREAKLPGIPKKRTFVFDPDTPFYADRAVANWLLKRFSTISIVDNYVEPEEFRETSFADIQTELSELWHKCKKLECIPTEMVYGGSRRAMIDKILKLRIIHKAHTREE
jgi:hypothetical protein